MVKDLSPAVMVIGSGRIVWYLLVVREQTMLLADRQDQDFSGK